MKQTNKPIKNFQKKKYYTKDLKKPFGSQGSSNRNTKGKKTSSWLDGTFAVDAKTFEVKHTPALYQKGQGSAPK